MMSYIASRQVDFPESMSISSRKQHMTEQAVEFKDELEKFVKSQKQEDMFKWLKIPNVFSFGTFECPTNLFEEIQRQFASFDFIETRKRTHHTFQ